MTAVVVVGCKRPPSWEEIYDPLAKRCRDIDWQPLDAGPTCSDQEARQTACAVIDAYKTAAEKRERAGLPVEDGAAEACGVPGPDKRARQLAPSASRVAPGDASVRECTESVVRALHSCPSTEEATSRCGRVLAEFYDGVRSAELRRREVVDAPALERHDEEDRPQEGSQRQTNHILMRAVYHLAQHCKKLEANAEEAAGFRAALEQSQEQLRRVAHSNEVLQGHLMVHLEGGR